jgi:putative two-component system response regulator
MNSLCQELSTHPRFHTLLDQEKIELISKLAPLHDIGKVGLPDHLLRKTTGFTVEEYDEVKKHVLYGRDAIANAELRVGSENDELLRYAKDIVYSHHERWDGTGYPEGLKGEAIPWAGRLMALADAYDAIVSRRIYKEPIPHDEAVQIIIAGKGTLFDPDVVDAFLKVEHQWREISRTLDDTTEVKVED